MSTTRLTMAQALVNGDTEAYLRAHWQPGDLVLTMGCGNINLLNEQMQQHGDTKK